MRDQAALPLRGSEVRFHAELPADVLEASWIKGQLPANYFAMGKADKLLAAFVLDQLSSRSVVGDADRFWEKPGSAFVLYLGYQWRPDPACGLIALSAGQALAQGIPLVVVWPRIFLSDGAGRRSALAALTRFKSTGDGPMKDLGLAIGLSAEALEDFRARVSTGEDQYGVFSTTSKTSRILADTAQLLIAGDAAIHPR
jgi:hypothetical protein